MYPDAFKMIADCKPPGHHGHHPNSPEALYATVKPKTPKPEGPIYENVGCRSPGRNHVPPNDESMYSTVNKPHKPSHPDEPIYGNIGHGHHGKHHRPGENEVLYGNLGDDHCGGHQGNPDYDPTYADLKFSPPGGEPIYDNVGFRGPCHHHGHRHHKPDTIYSPVKGPAPPGHRGPNHGHSGHHRHHSQSNDEEEIYGTVGNHPPGHHCAHTYGSPPPLPPRPPNGLPPIPGSRGGKAKPPKKVGCFGKR